MGFLNIFASLLGELSDVGCWNVLSFAIGTKGVLYNGVFPTPARVSRTLKGVIKPGAVLLCAFRLFKAKPKQT